MSERTSKKELTRREIDAAAEYARTVDKVPVLARDLRPAMVIVSRSGARREVLTVGEDRADILASAVRRWETRGLLTTSATCYVSKKIDAWQTPGADLEREIEEWTGGTLCVVDPRVANTPLWVERSSCPE